MSNPCANKRAGATRGPHPASRLVEASTSDGSGIHCGNFFRAARERLVRRLTKSARNTRRDPSGKNHRHALGVDRRDDASP